MVASWVMKYRPTEQASETNTRGRQAAGMRARRFLYEGRLVKTKTFDISALFDRRYFLCNKNTGWRTVARSKSSSEDSAVTPKS